MISYNPQVTDRSGEIMANASAQASQTQALAMTNFGDSLSKAIANIGLGFEERESKKAKGRAFRGFMEVMGPSIGMDTEKLAQISGKDKLKGDLDWYHAGEMVRPILPAIVNRQYLTEKLGVQQNAPYVAQGIRNQQNIAGGNVPHGGGVPQSPAGMAPVEPPLPVADENLPPVGGAPMAAPSTSVPGGQASIDAINRDRQRRGLPPIK